MKHLPKIGAVSARLAVLPPYEPVTRRFYLQIANRVPQLGRVRRGADLFFMRRTASASAGVQNFFIRKTEIERHLHTTFKIAFLPRSSTMFYKTSVSPVLHTQSRERVVTEKRSEVSTDGLHDVLKVFKTVSKQKGAPLRSKSILPELRGSLSERLIYSKEGKRRYREERAGDVSDKVQKVRYAPESVKRQLEPVTLHYRSEASEKRPPQNLQSEKEIKKVTLHNIEKESISESREVRIEKIKEIERISEKVYTLVMKKWEQERRRRGVLYE